MLRRSANRRPSVAVTDTREKLAVFKRADCLGEECPYFSGERCNSRLELIDVSLEESSRSVGAKFDEFAVEDCRFALYGHVCMATDEQIVVRRFAESPNGNASAAEIVGREGRIASQRLVLNTPPEAIEFR